MSPFQIFLTIFPPAVVSLFFFLWVIMSRIYMERTVTDTPTVGFYFCLGSLMASHFPTCIKNQNLSAWFLPRRNLFPGHNPFWWYRCCPTFLQFIFILLVNNPSLCFLVARCCVCRQIPGGWSKQLDATTSPSPCISIVHHRWSWITTELVQLPVMYRSLTLETLN